MLVIAPDGWGEWWFRTSHGGVWPGEAAGLLEMADGLPLTVVQLCGVGGRLGELPRVIDEAGLRTDPFNAERQRNRVAQVRGMLEARARLVTQHGGRGLGRVCEVRGEERRLSVADRARLSARSLTRFASVQADETLRSDHWSIGVVDAPIDHFLAADFQPKVDWLPMSDREVFGADPFGVPRADGSIDVFYEHFDFAIGQGQIAQITWNAGAWSSSVVRLAVEGVHLSYPFVFELQGERFAIPESSQNGRVDLYRAVASGWRFERTLLEFAGLDATVFRHDERWWLFATDFHAAPLDVLHAWHAESPLGPWTAHALNPLKIDVRCARPGGTPFVFEGQLYRPAQDGTSGYGGAVAIQRVDELTPTRFRETIVRRVFPLAGRSDGVHTLSSAGARTLIDGKHRRVVPSTIQGRLAGKLRGLLR